MWPHEQWSDGGPKPRRGSGRKQGSPARQCENLILMNIEKIRKTLTEETLIKKKL